MAELNLGQFASNVRRIVDQDDMYSEADKKDILNRITNVTNYWNASFEYAKELTDEEILQIINTTRNKIQKLDAKYNVTRRDEAFSEIYKVLIKLSSVVREHMDFMNEFKEEEL